jgi:hypothetical protein
MTRSPQRYRSRMGDEAPAAADTTDESAVTVSGTTESDQVTAAAPDDAVSEPTDEAAQTPTDWGTAYTSMVRLGAGLVGTVLDRAQHADSSLPEEPAPDDPTAEPVADGDLLGSVLFGLAADLPDRIGRVTASVTENTGPIRSVVSWGWRVTAASPIGWVVAKPVDAVRERVDAEAERLAAIGRSEYAQGRVLFESVVDNAIDGVLDNVSESEALNELIREQALGMGGAAIQEVRETGAAADGLTDAIVRKLLRRPPRPLPPMPETGAE